MDKKRKKRPPTRQLVQLYAALLYNAHLKGFAEGDIFRGVSKAVCVPGLNCYSCPAAVGACPLGALQNALSASGQRAGWYVLGILLLFGAALGRTVCGWLCPMGMLQELLHKIPTPKIKKSRATRALSGLKYAVLAIFAVILPLWFARSMGLPIPAFCKYICPAGTLEGALGLLAHPRNEGMLSMLGALFTRKFVILAAVALLCVFCYRAFCRFLCPLGAIYSLFNRLALTGVRVDADRCSGCGLCARRCGMDVRRPGDRECISCGQCVDDCARGAISLKCGKITLTGPEAPSPKRIRRGRIAWLAALAALAAALLSFNLRDMPAETSGAPAPAEVFESDAPVGSAIGERLADFTAPLVGGGEFRLSDYRGRVVLINLWATYCAPCVRELPLFDRLSREYPEAEVLAVHSSLVTEDVAAYLADKGWEIDFAVDSDGGEIYGIVGGSSVLPQTIVLNPRGEVAFHETGSVTYEKLLAMLAQAGGENPSEP